MRRPAVIPAGPPGVVFEDVALHAVGWLALGSAVGLLLALLLLFPGAGAVMAPLTYGRWAPVHLDVTLYGWCGLPLVGMLLRLYRGGAASDRLSRLAPQVWSGALLAGAFSWLAGQTSGKPFLDWTGAARGLFLGNLLFLAGVLLVGLAGQGRVAGDRAAVAVKALLWAGLAAIPVAMLVATDARSYPPVDPESGGPTGGSLLGSSLAVVAILVALPWTLGIQRREHRGATGTLAALLVAHAGVFLAVAPGDHGPHEPLQQAALLSLLVWAAVIPWFLRRFPWPAGTGPWRTAVLAWGGVLLATGLAAFVPGVLARVKFTDALVGHAHVAMAGLASSLAVVVLETLNRETRLAGLFAGRVPFVAWHAGLAVHVVALTAAGIIETADPGVLFRPDIPVTVLYAVRALAGAVTLVAATTWLVRSWRRVAA